MCLDYLRLENPGICLQILDHQEVGRVLRQNAVRKRAHQAFRLPMLGTWVQALPALHSAAKPRNSGAALEFQGSAS